MTDHTDLIARLRHFGAKPPTEQARGCIGSYIELCTQAADALEAATPSEREKRLEAALREIETLDYTRAAVNGCAFTAHKIACTALAEQGEKK